MACFLVGEHLRPLHVVEMVERVVGMLKVGRCWYVVVVCGKGEHESGSSTSICVFIRGKPTGQMTHRSELLNGTGLYRSG